MALRFFNHWQEVSSGSLASGGRFLHGLGCWLLDDFGSLFCLRQVMRHTPGKKAFLAQPKMSISQDAEKKHLFFCFEIKSRQLALLYILTKKLPRNVRAISSSFNSCSSSARCTLGDFSKISSKVNRFMNGPSFLPAASAAIWHEPKIIISHPVVASQSATKESKTFRVPKNAPTLFVCFQLAHHQKLDCFQRASQKTLVFSGHTAQKKKRFSAGTPLKNKFVFSGHTAQK